MAKQATKSRFPGKSATSAGGTIREIFATDPVAVYEHETIFAGQKSNLEDRALRNLMLAILEDGIACFQRYYFKPSRSTRQLSQEAEEWMNSKENELFSFESICDSLGLNPELLRTELKRWKSRQVMKGISALTPARQKILAAKAQFTA